MFDERHSSSLFFIVSESDKGSWIGSERFSFFPGKTGMATLRITYLGSWT